MTTTNNQNETMIKHSSVIAMSNTITLLQRKLFNYLVGHAFVFLQSQEIHDIKISSLKNGL